MTVRLKKSNRAETDGKTIYIIIDDILIQTHRQMVSKNVKFEVCLCFNQTLADNSLKLKSDVRKNIQNTFVVVLVRCCDSFPRHIQCTVIFSSMDFKTSRKMLIQIEGNLISVTEANKQLLTKDFF